jgi:flagellar protein FliO/FliZ
MLAFEFGRMLLALALVLGLLWLCSKVGRGRQNKGRRWMVPGVDPGRIEVMDRRSLGRHSSIAVVRAAGRIVVVGQTPQQISVLLEAEAERYPDPDGGDRTGIGTGAVGASGLVGTDEDMSMPGLASTMGVDSPRAWDAFVERLREMTVRH